MISQRILVEREKLRFSGRDVYIKTTQKIPHQSKYRIIKKQSISHRQIVKIPLGSLIPGLPLIAFDHELTNPTIKNSNSLLSESVNSNKVHLFCFDTLKFREGFADHENAQ